MESIISRDIAKIFSNCMKYYDSLPWLALLRAREIFAIKELLDCNPSGLILDLGCGDGFIIKQVYLFFIFLYL